MCIVCNCDEAGDDFLIKFERARSAMKEATEAMRRCSEIHRDYDRTHKLMVKLTREWNRVEQQRESIDGGAHPE